MDRRRAGEPAPPEAWLRALPRLAAPVGRPAWPLDVVLVDDDRMAALNGSWRGQEEATDVLSFSYLSDAGTGAPALPAGAAGAARDLWRAADEDAADAAAGEVVIAPAFVAARCAERGWPLDAELALLTAHGALHVLGWEHGTPAAEAAMREREAALLAAAGFAHPLGAEPADGIAEGGGTRA